MYIIKLLHVVVWHIWKNTQTGTISSYLHASLPASQIRRTDGKSPHVYSGDDECDVLDAQSQRGVNWHWYIYGGS